MLSPMKANNSETKRYIIDMGPKLNHAIQRRREEVGGTASAVVRQAVESFLFTDKFTPVGTSDD